MYGEPNFVYIDTIKDKKSFSSTDETWILRYTENFHYPLYLKVASWCDSLWTLEIYFKEEDGIYTAFTGYQIETNLLNRMD